MFWVHLFLPVLTMALGFWLGYAWVLGIGKVETDE